MQARWVSMATFVIAGAGVIAWLSTPPTTANAAEPNRPKTPPATQPATSQPATSRPADNGEVFLDIKLDAALKKAAQEKKVVFIDFYTTWCGPCKMLDKQTWPNPTVRKFLRQHTIPLRLDAEREKVIAKRYRINVYPSLVFIKPDGTERGRFAGFRDPQAFLDEAGSVLGLPRNEIPKVPAEKKEESPGAPAKKP